MLPHLDSEAMAFQRKCELDISRDSARALGHSAVDAIREGAYLNNLGERVSWREAIDSACATKVSIPPEATLPTGTFLSSPRPGCRSPMKRH